TSYNAEIQSDIDVIAVNYTKLKTVSEKKDRLNKRIELIQSLQKQRPVLTLGLNSLVESIPSTVYLEELRKDGDKFTFRGKAASADEVATLMRSLKNTMWFDKVFMVSYTEYAPDSKDVQNKDGSTELTVKTEKSGSGNVVVPRVPEDVYGSFVVTAELVPSNIDKVGFGDAEVREIQIKPSDLASVSINDPSIGDDGPKVLGVVKGRALPLDSGVNPESAKSELSPDRALEMRLRTLQRGSN
ncbi:TPA: PilN domain-containing protein, partial [Acinetobacter baumannii]|nr:PilN domain-containing protein [Acinetobacter baumannii]